jgi:diacylglycerol kinase family enzyme
MADSEKTESKSREISLDILSLDGTSTSHVVLETNEDPSKPPRLIGISKKPQASQSHPQAGADRETHVVLSIGSGHQLAAQFHTDILEPILKALQGDKEPAIQVHTTESETSILDLTNKLFFPQANEGKPLRIILASGDGGIVDLVNGLLAQPTGPSYTAPQVLLLPLGTANALYHSINTGVNNTWGLNALSSTTTKPLPLFTASFSPSARLLVDEARKEEQLPTDPSTGHGILHGAVVCSWGMHASLVADSDTTLYRKFGLDRFKMAAKEALYPSSGAAPHAYKGSVSVLHGETWTELPEQEHMYVLASLVSNLEQSFVISPASKPLDGSLHLVRFGPMGGDAAMRIMGLAYQAGKHVEDGEVLYEEVDGLRIEFGGKEEEGRWRRVCVDGKIVKVEGDGWVEVRKEKRRVVDVVV